GRVIEGIDIMSKIKQVPVTSVGPYQNVPEDVVLIKRIRRVTIEQLKDESGINLEKKTQPLPTSST
ncbi:MAG: hypothetical protein VXX85_07965, partial [Candidatus Margulisiibacteriota bacterium]|nr:hypothetical protein [Candidatus Margulisiibacteriota bacterium]